MPKALEQVRAKAILSRRKGIQEQDGEEEYEVFVEACLRGSRAAQKNKRRGKRFDFGCIGCPKIFYELRGTQYMKRFESEGEAGLLDKKLLKASHRAASVDEICGLEDLYKRA